MITFDDLKTWVTDRMRKYGTENQKLQIPYQLGESTGDFLLGRKPREEVAAVAEATPASKPPNATESLVNRAGVPEQRKDTKSKLLTVAGAETLIASPSDDPPARVARLSLADGTVTMQTAGLDEWTPAEINRPITTGDHLWVDDIGHAELQIGSGLLRLSENTDFSLLNLDDLTTQVKPLREPSLSACVESTTAKRWKWTRRTRPFRC